MTCNCDFEPWKYEPKIVGDTPSYFGLPFFEILSNLLSPF